MTRLLEIDRVTKTYPGVVALSDVSFDLEAGEVHCLVGENGAGKSTLMNVLCGAVLPDRGSIRISGRELHLLTPRDAQLNGIGIIHQDLRLIPDLSVAENITLGNEPLRRGFIESHRLHENASVALSMLGETIDLRTKVRNLPIAKQQMVEIAKALSRKSVILAFDEPTAPLTERETTRLFEVIRSLKQTGIGIIYISHRLEEIFEIGDRVTVLRDGKNAAGSTIRETDRSLLIRWMVGREMDQEYPVFTTQQGEEILRFDHVSGQGIDDISLSVYRGEVLGIGGLVGSGRSELAYTLLGENQLKSGSIIFHGAPYSPKSPFDGVSAGIGLLPEDRNRLGVLPNMCVRENVTIASLRNDCEHGFLVSEKESNRTRESIAAVQLHPENPEMNVQHLSGGNRQKVILARWLLTDVDVLVFDEPTAGIDVGARYEIYQLLIRAAANGKAIIMISSDLQELIGMSSRIAVLCEGKLSGILSRDEATQERIMSLATSPSS